jgi:hypothetical protein
MRLVATGGRARATGAVPAASARGFQHEVSQRQHALSARIQQIDVQHQISAHGARALSADDGLGQRRVHLQAAVAERQQACSVHAGRCKCGLGRADRHVEQRRMQRVLLDRCRILARELQLGFALAHLEAAQAVPARAETQLRVRIGGLAGLARTRQQQRRIDLALAAVDADAQMFDAVVGGSALAFDADFERELSARGQLQLQPPLLVATELEGR